MLGSRVLKVLIFYPILIRATDIGIVSYWSSTSGDFSKIPSSSLVVINPDSGIFKPGTTTLSTNTAGFIPVSEQLNSVSALQLMYVPTGYFDHTCDVNGKCQTISRIEAQIKAYVANFPHIAGIFFDEASSPNNNCAAYATEFAKLRSLARKYLSNDKIIAFNPGYYENCIISAAQANEIIVIFENTGSSLSNSIQDITSVVKYANANNVKTWIIAYSTNDAVTFVSQAKSTGATYAYATDQDAYNSIPGLWNQELKLLSNSDSTAASPSQTTPIIATSKVNSLVKLPTKKSHKKRFGTHRRHRHRRRHHKK